MTQREKEPPLSLPLWHLPLDSVMRINDSSGDRRRALPAQFNFHLRAAKLA